MVIPPLIGILINPYNRYINPYYWVDDHPLLYGNNGSLDPGTYIYIYIQYISYYHYVYIIPSSKPLSQSHWPVKQNRTPNWMPSAINKNLYDLWKTLGSTRNFQTKPSWVGLLLVSFLRPPVDDVLHLNSGVNFYCCMETSICSIAMWIMKNHILVVFEWISALWIINMLYQCKYIIHLDFAIWPLLMAMIQESQEEAKPAAPRNLGFLAISTELKWKKRKTNIWL